MLGADYYYLHDHLASPLLRGDLGVCYSNSRLSEEKGCLILERYEYDAYGKPTYWEGDI